MPAPCTRRPLPLRPPLIPALLLLLSGCAAEEPAAVKPGIALDLDGDGFAGDDDCDDNDGAIHPGAIEVCDGADNDCDAAVDEGGGQGVLYYADADGDGYGSPAAMQRACTLPDGYATTATDCDDADSAIHPGAQEVCAAEGAGAADEDCDGLADDADPAATGLRDWYADQDGDGAGDSARARAACAAPPGFVAAGGDCDDADPAAAPGGAEVCDGRDNDCDGLSDDADPGVSGRQTFYADNDGDGFGTALATLTACDLPAGYSALDTDCDDLLGAVWPGASEICDGRDNDCDRLTDDQDGDVLGVQIRYADVDSDGYGDPATARSLCDATGTGDGSDCDDRDAAVNPGAAEACNGGVDDDCDGLVDDDDPGAPVQPWYVDSDADGWGDSDDTVIACEAPAGYVDNDLDPLEDAAFSAISATVDLQEVTDLAVSATAIYAVGFDAGGAPVVVGIDRTLGTVTELYADAPLLQPSGIALSADGATLYITDVASTADGGTGGLFALSTSGGAMRALGIGATAEMPGDVALDADGRTLWVSAIRASDGAPVIYAWDGALRAVFASGLEEPMALAASTDRVYAVDARASGAALLSLDPAAPGAAPEVLATGLRLAWPGGVALSADAGWIFVTTLRPASVRAVAADGSREESLDLRGLIGYPVGLSGSGDRLYVGDSNPGGGIGWWGY